MKKFKVWKVQSPMHEKVESLKKSKSKVQSPKSNAWKSCKKKLWNILLTFFGGRRSKKNKPRHASNTQRSPTTFFKYSADFTSKNRIMSPTEIVFSIQYIYSDTNKYITLGRAINLIRYVVFFFVESGRCGRARDGSRWLPTAWLRATGGLGRPGEDAGVSAGRKR